MPMGSDVSKLGGKLTKVKDHKKICMVTNKAFEKDQVPIEVEEWIRMGGGTSHSVAADRAAVIAMATQCIRF